MAEDQMNTIDSVFISDTPKYMKFIKVF